MKIYYVSYFADGFPKVSIVTGNSEKQVKKLINDDCCDFQLIDIREVSLSSPNIIHTEIIEVI